MNGYGGWRLPTSGFPSVRAIVLASLALASLALASLALASLALASLAACSHGVQTARVLPGASGAAIRENTSADVDHVIVAIDSLERGIRLLREATGVTATYGGAHPGRGTRNALMSLGPGKYLELLAPNPSDSAGAASAAFFPRFRTLTPVGWALHTGNADSLVAVLARRGVPGGAVIPGLRARPDGSILRWRTLNPWGSSRGVLPFFIEWSPSGPHPSTDSPSGCSLMQVLLTSPSADSLRVLLDRASVRVPIEAAASETMQLTLDCPRGRLRLPVSAP